MNEVQGDTGHEISPEETVRDLRDDRTLRALMADLEGELKTRRRQQVQHMIWAFLGVSPAAILPMLGLVSGGSIALAIVLAVGVTGMEGWRAHKAAKAVHALEWRIWELHTGEGKEQKGEGESGP